MKRRKLLYGAMLILLFVVVGVLLPHDGRVEAATASGQCGENVYWSLDEDGTLTISGTGEMDDYGYDGAPWYNHRENIKNVVITEGVTKIGDRAFYLCYKLLSVEIPDSITDLGEFIFKGCSNINSIIIGEQNVNYYVKSNCLIERECNEIVYGCITSVIPEDITAIRRGAFDGTGLRCVYFCGTEREQWDSIVIGGDNWSITNSPVYLYKETEPTENKGQYWHWVDGEPKKYAVRSGKFDLYYLNGPEDSVTYWSIDNDGILFISDDENINVDNGDEYDFEDNKNMIKKAIFDFEGKYAPPLCDCINLTTVEVRNFDVAFWFSAFARCTSLTSINLPEGLTRIECWMFEDCISLKSIEIPSSVTIIDTEAFKGCISLESVEIPKSVKTLGECCFSNCISLETVKIPKNIVEGWYGAFNECSGLKCVEYEDGCKDTGLAMFINCESLTEVKIPSTIELVGATSFWGCSALKKIVMPEGVESIGYESFENCKNLTEIVIPKSMKNIWTGFGGTSENVNIYYGGGNIDEWNKIECGDDGECIGDVDAFLRGATIYFYSETMPTENVDSYWHWVDGTPTVWNYETDGEWIYIKNEDGYTVRPANDTMNKPEVVIPSEYNGMPVLLIEDSAFSGYNKITKVTIPASVIRIGDYAFSDCTALTNVEILVSTNNTRARSVQSVGGLISIGKKAFWGCTSLKSIIVPESLTSIGESAFGNATNIDAVYYYGDSTGAWRSITIDSGNEVLESCMIYCYSETAPTDNEGSYWHNGDNSPVIWEVEIPTPTPTVTPTQTPTVTPTQTSTVTPTQTPTETPTQTPTVTPTQTPTETPTQTPTETPTQIPTETPKQTPTETPTPTEPIVGDNDNVIVWIVLFVAVAMMLVVACGIKRKMRS